MAMKTATKKAIENLGFKIYGNFVMIESVLYPLPLVQGNDKLGKDVWHASTLPTNQDITVENPETGDTITETGTCPLSCPGCYGTAGHYVHNDIKYYLIMRTKLLRQYPDIYFKLVRIQLENENIKKLRIHATGDFIPGEALSYYNVLIDFPSIKAWTYTKVTGDTDISLLDTLENVNIVKSIIPGRGFNFGPVAYIAATYYYLLNQAESVYICRCGIDKNQHCSNCDGCSDHKYVLFIEHSTGYNAAADYGYNKMIQLIESQNMEVVTK